LGVASLLSAITLYTSGDATNDLNGVEAKFGHGRMPGTASVRHHDGDSHAVEHLPRNAAEYGLLESGMSVAAHDQEIEAFICRD
jgi:hypothetical protein